MICPKKTKMDLVFHIQIRKTELEFQRMKVFLGAQFEKSVMVNKNIYLVTLSFCVWVHLFLVLGQNLR